MRWSLLELTASFGRTLFVGRILGIFACLICPSDYTTSALETDFPYGTDLLLFMITVHLCH